MALKEKMIAWFISGAMSGDGIRRKVVMWKIQKEINNMKITGSWQTSLAGIATILTALGVAISAMTDNDPNTNVNLAATITAITTGIGLIMARDNNKSSEQVGAGNTGGK